MRSQRQPGSQPGRSHRPWHQVKESIPGPRPYSAPREVRGHTLRHRRTALNRPASVLSGNNLAAIIVPARGADMMGPLQFATIGAFATGLDSQRMMRPPHIALGGRGLSFWNRHGENTPWTKLNPPIQPQTTGRLAGKTGRGAKPNRVLDARAFSAGKSKCFYLRLLVLPGGATFSLARTANGLSLALGSSWGASNCTPGARG